MVGKGGKERLQRDTRKPFGVMHVFIFLIVAKVFMVSRFQGIHMLKLTKLYPLNRTLDIFES